MEIIHGEEHSIVSLEMNATVEFLLAKLASGFLRIIRLYKILVFETLYDCTEYCSILWFRTIYIKDLNCCGNIFIEEFENAEKLFSLAHKEAFDKEEIKSHLKKFHPFDDVKWSFKNDLKIYQLNQLDLLSTYF